MVLSPLFFSDVPVYSARYPQIKHPNVSLGPISLHFWSQEFGDMFDLG